MSPAITAARLHKQISNGASTLTILDGVDLRVEAGQSVAIIGPSGAGKTTLLALLAGLDTPSSGSIKLAGQELSGLDEEQRAALRAGRVGFVFQSFQLLSGFTALENVQLSAELAGIAGPEQIARQTLEQVGLAARLEHYPQQLSGGEQQRVALARAFAGRPQILFADEPTGNLDTRTGAQIIDLLFGLNAEHGTTLVLVTHDEALAARCEQRLQLIDGRLQ